MRSGANIVLRLMSQVSCGVGNAWPDMRYWRAVAINLPHAYIPARTVGPISLQDIVSNSISRLES